MELPNLVIGYIINLLPILDIKSFGTVNKRVRKFFIEQEISQTKKSIFGQGEKDNFLNKILIMVCY